MAAYRIKLKCPTCYAETYVRVEEDQTEREVINQVEYEHNYRGTDHERPEVIRREPIAEAAQ